MNRILAIILSSCIIATSTTSISANASMKDVANDDFAVIDIDLSIEEATYETGESRTNTDYYIRLLVDGVVRTFVLSLTGVTKIADAVRDWVWSNMGKATKYTYTYTEDTGCWKPEFPNNPFCRAAVPTE